MNAQFSFKIFTAVDTLPEKWDTLARNNIFLTTDYLSILEQSAPENMICHYIGIYKNEQLAGISISQFLDLSTVSSFGERDSCMRTKVRSFVFKNFSSNVLVIGNNMLTGQNGCCFDDSILASERYVLLQKATRELKLKLTARKLKIHLTIFKDFNEIELENFKIPAFKTYYKFTTQPNMILDIRENWHSFDDYINNLSKKYRDQYKRVRKKADGINKRKLSLDEITAYRTRIHELYLNVAQNAPFNTFYLTENHFEVFKKSLKDNFLFYGYFINDHLIGFNTLIKNGKDIDTYFLGYDETCQREKMLYLNMLYDMIAFSTNKKYKRIIFARTALEIKSSVGATAVNMYSFMQHSNPLINLFIPTIFGFFEPKIEWKERNPFKELSSN
ncbi:peptidogalycan biosysnthesis protein [Flavobacterium muglaense]|uniref:N-acetyltransferase n=1 Tax=Flavobacterium muglaense TaxID=2764716 RepID=A0A923MWI3_9FLAO|nr:peptidogalycan biosysnthesis protein [Flavobacterium muglaense]MBC5836449.1 N-acetyltransferase [Flavobacterium muglaense]MBC5842979.1 N-acetyltransferase [Flavobacterium muglaense]